MLSSLGIKLIIIAVVATGSFIAGFTLEYNLATGRAAKLELERKEEIIKAVENARLEQQRLDQIAIELAKQEANNQARITAATVSRLKEVKRHVKNSNNCVTYGFIRVLDAGVHGVNAESLILPAGKSDDSCSEITTIELANSIIGNYGTCESNSEQLNALIESLRMGKKK